MKLELNKKILSKNEEAAFTNTELFIQNNQLCLNVISSPGSGKTTILSRTIIDLKKKLQFGVIEGDLRTDIDAQKIRKTGAAAIQIETHGSCHLNAEQITRALYAMPAGKRDVIFIENVGNLVCPSDFLLGEQGRVVVLSVAEGDDKPAKYPGTFAKADVLLINKMDLIDYLDFDIERVIADARTLNNDLEIFPVSAKTGRGMDQWYQWLCEKRQQCLKTN